MNITDLIGNTPLVELERMWSHPRVRVFGKLEGHNPGGSVKDRAALGMIKGALERGEIKPGDKLVEATSGNTGIALAMVARKLGLQMTLIMPDSATEERKRTMRAYGAELIETPSAKTIEYSRELAQEMADSGEYVQLNQFANPDNYKAHVGSTGPEIWRDTDGKITHFVSAMGTTGTIMGVSRYLKAQDPGVQIVGTQPMTGSRIPGIRKWSPEFVPKFFERERVDRVVEVSAEQAKARARELAREEGIFCGMSSGGACEAALQVAAGLEEGVVVFVVCDRGDRYLSSDLFG